MINGSKVLDHSIRWAMVGGGKGSQIGYIHRSAAQRDNNFKLVAGAFDINPERGIEFGKELVFASLPGEPFNGISRAIQEKSPFKRTVVIALAQSQASYTPMPECFERGGYETKPGVNTSAIDNAPRMIQAVLDNF